MWSEHRGPLLSLSALLFSSLPTFAVLREVKVKGLMLLRLGQENNCLFQCLVKKTREQLKQSHWSEQPWCDQWEKHPLQVLPTGFPFGCWARKVSASLWHCLSSAALNFHKQVLPDCWCAGKLLRDRPLTHQRGKNQSRDQALYFKGVCVCVGSLSNPETLHMYSGAAEEK